MNRASHEKITESLLRYCHTLAPDAEVAERIFSASVQYAEKKKHHDIHDLIFHLFGEARRLLLAEAGPPANSPWRELSEPGRSAYLLLCLGMLAGEELEEFFGLNEKSLASTLNSARQALTLPQLAA